jgi:hypothetical protein
MITDLTTTTDLVELFEEVKWDGSNWNYPAPLRLIAIMLSTLDDFGCLESGVEHSEGDENYGKSHLRPTLNALWVNSLDNTKRAAEAAKTTWNSTAEETCENVCQCIVSHVALLIKEHLQFRLALLTELKVCESVPVSENPDDQAFVYKEIIHSLTPLIQIMLDAESVLGRSLVPTATMTELKQFSLAD